MNHGDTTFVSTKLPSREEMFTDETIQKLSDGFLDKYEPDLKNVKGKLKELTDKQDVLVDKLTAEYNKLYICHFDCEVRITISTIKMYKDKLLYIRKDMLELLDKIGDLKERALRLQQQKKDELQKRAQQIQREQDLILNKSKPSTSKKN